MNRILTEFASALQDPNRQYSAFDLLFELAEGLGFDDLNLALSDYHSGTPLEMLSTMDEAWLIHYASSGYPAYDSLIELTQTMEGYVFLDIDGCKNLPCRDAKIGAQIWDEVRNGDAFSNFIATSRSPSTGILTGYNFVSSLSRAELQRATRDHMSTLKMAIGLSQVAVLDDLSDGSFNGTIVPLSKAKVLSPREREVLMWLSEGYRVDRIAERLGLSNATVNFHINSAKKRLGARTREQAVALMIRTRQM